MQDATGQPSGGPPVVTMQDFVDIGYAFECAAALAVGWAIASALVGASTDDWFFQEHRNSPIGLYRVLPAWLLAWPLGAAFKAVATLEYARATPGVTASILDMQAIAMDGAGLLLVLAAWRTWLLAWASDNGVRLHPSVEVRASNVAIGRDGPL